MFNTKSNRTILGSFNDEENYQLSRFLGVGEKEWSVRANQGEPEDFSLPYMNGARHVEPCQAAQ